MYITGPPTDWAGAADPARVPSRFEQRVLVDANRWRTTRQVPWQLTRVQDALWTDRRIRLRYRRGDGGSGRFRDY